MSRIVSIFPYNFRNLVNRKTEVNFSQVLFIGPNGQGKTNFLESIYYLCLGSSFRANRDEEMCRIGCKEMGVNGEIHSDGMEKEISVLHGRKKEIVLNGKVIRDRKELITMLPCVVFVHGDIDFISGSPEKRRIFLDQTASLIDPLYLSDYRRFRKVLKNRNRALKEGSTALLTAMDEELVESGIPIQQRRSRIVTLINEVFSEIFLCVSATPNCTVRVEYSPSWKDLDKDAILNAVHKRHKEELIVGSSLSGPHRDKLHFFYDGKDFRIIASTGQLRLASLILRSVQALLCSRFSKKDPILLLDDVLLELDSECRQRFLSNLPPYTQSFFTFLPDEQYRFFDAGDTCFYTVKQGELVPK